MCTLPHLGEPGFETDKGWSTQFSDGKKARGWEFQKRWLNADYQESKLLPTGFGTPNGLPLYPATTAFGLADRGRLASMPGVPLKTIHWGGCVLGACLIRAPFHEYPEL